MDYLLHLLIFSLIFGMVALSLNVSSGFSGLISLSHAAFYGIGAYSAALLPQIGINGLILESLCAAAICLVLALPLSLVALRVVDDYFIVCSMGVGVLIYSVLNNASGLTQGPLGVTGIPSARLLGWQIDQNWEWLLVCAGCVSLWLVIVRGLARSSFGRLLIALSEDEVFCTSLGKDVGGAKVKSFLLGAVMAVVPGVLYAHYISYVDPGSFTVSESIFFLSILIIGGMGSVMGCVWASVIMVFLPELLRLLGIPSAVAANVRQMLYGFALIAIVWSQTRDHHRAPIVQ